MESCELNGVVRIIQSMSKSCVFRIGGGPRVGGNRSESHVGACCSHQVQFVALPYLCILDDSLSTHGFNSSDFMEIFSAVADDLW